MPKTRASDLCMHQVATKGVGTSPGARPTGKQPEGLSTISIGQRVCGLDPGFGQTGDVLGNRPRRGDPGSSVYDHMGECPA